jgi:hypothetical protein
LLPLEQRLVGAAAVCVRRSSSKKKTWNAVCVGPSASCVIAAHRVIAARAASGNVSSGRFPLCVLPLVAAKNVRRVHFFVKIAACAHRTAQAAARRDAPSAPQLAAVNAQQRRFRLRRNVVQKY